MGERGVLVSGGQAQRISLARGLLRGFPVLVLDEPTAGLDPETARRLVRDVLTTARDDGSTVVVISHVEVPAELVTRRVRIEAGRLSEVAVEPDLESGVESGVALDDDA
jgi:ATP-binding cassette subfamily C protein CydC